MKNMEAELPIKELQDVDWESLTKEQAASFGLQLSLFNDAVEANLAARNVAWSKANVLVSTIIIGGALLAFGMSAATILFACIGGQLGGAALSAWYVRQRRLDAARAQDDLVAEVNVIKAVNAR